MINYSFKVLLSYPSLLCAFALYIFFLMLQNDKHNSSNNVNFTCSMCSSRYMCMCTCTVYIYMYLFLFLCRLDMRLFVLKMPAAQAGESPLT